MSLARDTQVLSTPPVFEAVWRCVVCGESMRRCRVFDAIQ
jgi:L-lactate utilization protein LutB